MSTVKDEIQRLLDALPEDASYEDMQYALYVRERIARGDREVAEGKVLDQSEVELRMKQWIDG